MLKLGAKNKRDSEVVKGDRVFFYVKVNPLDVPKCCVRHNDWSIDSQGNDILKLRISEDGKNFKSDDNQARIEKIKIRPSTFNS